MMQSIKLWTIFSLLAISLMAGCAHIERPDAPLCGINTDKLQLRCYNIRKDYNNDGKRKKDAKPLVLQFKDANEMLVYLRGWLVTSPNGFGNILSTVREVREYCD